MMSVCYFTLSHGTATAVTNATDTAVATRWVENTVATYCCSLQRVRHTKKNKFYNVGNKKLARYRPYAASQ